MRGYKNYKTLCSIFATMQWHGSNSYLLVDSATTIPDNLDLITSVGDYVPPGTDYYDWDFYAPDVYDIVSEMDGMISGNATINASVSSSCGTGAYINVTSLEVALYAVDINGNTRTLADETANSSAKYVAKGASAEWGVMFWVPITRQHIAINERLFLRLRANYTAYDPISYTNGIHIGFGTDPAADEITLDIPFVV